MRAMAAAVMLLGLAGCGGGGNSSGADVDGSGTVSKAEMQAEAAKGGPIALTPGNWDYNIRFTEFDMGGDLPPDARAMVQGMMAKPITISHCLTPEEAAKNDATAFTGEAMKDCTISKFDRSGGNIDMAMACVTEGMTRNMTMKGSFTATSYTLAMDQSMTGGPAPMTMKGTMTGKRTGDCAG